MPLPTNSYSDTYGRAGDTNKLLFRAPSNPVQFFPVQLLLQFLIAFPMDHKTLLNHRLSCSYLNLSFFVCQVPRGGLEPPRSHEQRILSPLCLPIPPSRHTPFFLLRFQTLPLFCVARERKQYRKHNDLHGEHIPFRPQFVLLL